MEINVVDENNYPLFDGIEGLRQERMSQTAMQELIEDLKSKDVAHGMYWVEQPDVFFDKYLEKEKEQLEEARLKGYGEGYHEGLYDAENK